MSTSKKVCPICNNENPGDATICIHCGARLQEYPTMLVATPKISDANVDSVAKEASSFIDLKLIPEGGIGVHIAGEAKALYMPVTWEIIIGRKKDNDTTPDESFLDLTDMHAVTMGVSRRHAMLRRTISGYEVTDLSSRNGTWLNGERLVPNRAYPLASGSQLRIGNMRLLIMYHPAAKDSDKR